MAYYLKAKELEGKASSAEHKGDLKIYAYLKPSYASNIHAASSDVIKTSGVTRVSNFQYTCLFGPGLVALLDLQTDCQTLKKAIVTTTGSMAKNVKGLIKEETLATDTYQNAMVSSIVCCFDEDEVDIDASEHKSQHFANVTMVFEAIKLERTAYSTSHKKKSSDASVVSPGTSAVKK